MNKVCAVGTCDTKRQELQYVKSAVSAAEVAGHHPLAPGAVPGRDDRGAAIEAMGPALTADLETRDNIGGVIGLDGSGNTAVVTQAMRALPLGAPKVMASTRITLIRTTAEENRRFGEWITHRLNLCDGPLRLPIPEGGVSAIHVPGKPLYDPQADHSLFEALDSNIKQTSARRVIRLPLHITGVKLPHALAQTFREIA